MKSEITRFSEISRSYTLLIDGFNEETNRLVTVERMDFIPVYRVASYEPLNLKNVYERYFLSPVEANKHWSELQAERRYLF